MKEDAARALEAQLGGSVPPGIAELDESELADLAGAVRESRRRQAADLAAAGQRALQHIPRVLHRPIRKLAGG